MVGSSAQVVELALNRSMEVGNEGNDGTEQVQVYNAGVWRYQLGGVS